jgi:hypothetical protein
LGSKHLIKYFLENHSMLYLLFESKNFNYLESVDINNNESTSIP